MITAGFVDVMVRYNAEANRRWYRAAATLGDARRTEDRGAFFGSLHGTLCHILWADRMWMSRFAGWDKPVLAQKDSPTLYADFAELHAARVEADARLLAWSSEVTQEWLDGKLVWFSGSVQREMRQKRDILVMHMFNHQTHHRGQAHALITALGGRTGDTDLAFIL